jgi:hypothetical protein
MVDDPLSLAVMEGETLSAHRTFPPATVAQHVFGSGPPPTAIAARNAGTPKPLVLRKTGSPILR